MGGLKVGALRALNVTLCMKITSRAVQMQGRVVTQSDGRCTWSLGKAFAFSECPD